IIAPIKVPKEEDHVDVKNVTNDKSIFEAMGNGDLEGGKIALIVGAMLIAFIASLELVNWFIQLIFAGVTLQEILGYILAQIGYLMGISPAELIQPDTVLVTRSLQNDFI